mgnify:CR=1 FL=1
MARPGRNGASSVLRRLKISTLVGLLCFTVSIAWAAVVGMPEAVDEDPVGTLDFAGFLLLIVVITPIIESVIFAAFLFFIKRRTTAVLALYAISMFLFGWWAHGSDWGSVGKGVSFSLLAGLTYHSSVGGGLRAGIMSNITAHAIWNALSVLSGVLFATYLTI